MPRILAFGDSLTFGFDAATQGGRHPPEGRWPEVLAATLGVTVISEGLPGRTTAFDDHTGPACRNGVRALPVLLASHQPLDLVIVMLGTNDMKRFICGTAEGATAGLRRILTILRDWTWAPGCTAPQVLVLAPPRIGRMADGRWPGALDVAEGDRLAGLYAPLAAEFGAGFMDAGEVVSPSPIDGVHLDAAATAALAGAIAPRVAAMLGLTPTPGPAAG